MSDEVTSGEGGGVRSCDFGSKSLFNDPREPEASTPDESGSDAGVPR